MDGVGEKTYVDKRRVSFMCSVVDKSIFYFLQNLWCGANGDKGVIGFLSESDHIFVKLLLQ